MARLLFLPALFGRAAALSATLVQFDEASAFAVVRQDSGCFTQGLVWEPTVGVWYQSCGLPWQSNARQVSSDGDVLQQSALPSSEFAEGITIKDGHLYQLTWQSQRAYSYPVAARRGDAAFGGRQTLTYAGEGWGITTAPDGKLVVSNGTALLTFYDATPSSMAPVRTLLVTDDGEPVWQLNELEYVGDSIWANVWHSNRIAVIDPRTGAVSKWVDCTELVRRERAENGNAGVLNGIGLRDGVVWLTGKRWGRMYGNTPSALVAAATPQPSTPLPTTATPEPTPMSPAATAGGAALPSPAATLRLSAAALFVSAFSHILLS